MYEGEKLAVPTRQPEVMSRLAELEENSSLLLEMVSILADRLASVLGSPSPQETNKNTVRESFCEVSERMLSVIERLKVTQDRVTDLTSRLEV